MSYLKILFCAFTTTTLWAAHIEKYQRSPGHNPFHSLSLNDGYKLLAEVAHNTDDATCTSLYNSYMESQSDKNYMLVKAAHDGDVLTCTRLIEVGASVVNHPDSGYGAPLDKAVISGSVKTYQLLLTHGALHSPNFYPYQPFDRDWRPLETGMCRFLVDNGIAPINGMTIRLGAYQERRWIPLHSVACHGLDKICQILCERGAYVHALNDEQKTPVEVALERRHMPVAWHLIDFGAKTLPTDNISRFCMRTCFMFLTLKMLANDEPALIMPKCEAYSDRTLSSGVTEWKLEDLKPGARSVILRYAATHLKYEKIEQLLALGASPLVACPYVPEKFARTTGIIRHLASISQTPEERDEYLAVLQRLNAQILARHYQLRPALCRASEPILPDELITHIMAYDTGDNVSRALLPTIKKTIYLIRR